VELTAHNSGPHGPSSSHVKLDLAHLIAPHFLDGGDDCRLGDNTKLTVPLHHMLAPPLVTASISSSVQARLWKRLGSSDLSKNSPSLGCTDPRFLPADPPIAPYASELGAVTEGRDGEEVELLVLPMGPCCCARCL